MSFVILAFVVVLCSFASFVSSVSLGDQLHRDYTVYNTVPTNSSAALAAGWVFGKTCDPHRGISATFGAPEAATSTPMTLFFTAGGQVAGVGVNVYGDVKPQLVKKGFFEPIADGAHFIAVSFRSGAILCSGAKSQEVLGDSLIVNAGALGLQLPLTSSAAASQNWTRGACFYSMGYHYFYDLTTAPQMSWEAANLLPIVPMYTSNGEINAFFFASSVVQQGVFSAHWWEPVALIDYLMCKNWCDPQCTFHDTSAWSTLHIYLKDYTKATCPGDCSLHCCPSNANTNAIEFHS